MEEVFKRFVVCFSIDHTELVLSWRVLVIPRRVPVVSQGVPVVSQRVLVVCRGGPVLSRRVPVVSREETEEEGGRVGKTARDGGRMGWEEEGREVVRGLS